MSKELDEIRALVSLPDNGSIYFEHVTFLLALVDELTKERDQARCDYQSVLDNHVEALDVVRRERDAVLVRLAGRTTERDALAARLCDCPHCGKPLDYDAALKDSP